MNWSFATFTDKGERPINEDCVDLITTDLGLCAVLCDGLGGHDSGELASQCVCASIRKGFEEADSEADPVELIKKLADTAQEELLRQQEELGKQNGMRTTLCCVIIKDDQCVAAFVGDSRIYKFSDQAVETRSKDHSVPQYLVNMGEIKDKDIRHHPDRNKLIRVMGSEWEKPMYQLPEFSQPKQGDAYLLCSDGFWEWIEERDMERCLKNADSAEQWIKAMSEIVLRRGEGHRMDNYSAVVLWSEPPVKPKKTFFQKLFDN